MRSVTPSSDVPPLLKVRGPVDLIQAVPYLLGFHPAESLVAVALRGPRRRLDFTLRIDLPDDRRVGEDARFVAEHLARNRADAAVLLLYTDAYTDAEDDTEDVADLPGRSPVDAVARHLARRRIPVQEGLLVSRGRWWSYTCTVPTCCPPGGTPLPAPEQAAASIVAATAAYAGLGPLPSRDALVASLSPVRSVARASMAQALARAEEAITREPYPGDRAAYRRAETRRLLVDLLPRFAAPPVSVSDDDAARMILGIADVPLRDEVCGWAIGEHREALRSLLHYLVRRALPPHDVAPLTVLGLVAYQQGDGALASTALARALRADPTYRLALIAAQALAQGVRPEALGAPSWRTRP